MVDVLVEFLLARLDEDEQAARAAAPGPWTYSDIDSVAGGGLYDPTVRIADVDWDPEPEKIDRRIRRARPETEADATGEHIARHDPARVLVDVEAKRQIVAHLQAEFEKSDNPWWLGDVITPVLRFLAMTYVDHPDYREEWGSTSHG